MKIIRALLMATSILVPVVALAAPSSTPACCHGGHCCHHGCPFCAGGR